MEAGYCTRCRKHVHDLSAMRASELRRFLARRVGTEICVSYRVDPKGIVQLRSSSRLRTASLAAMVVLLAACAGYGTELETPDSPCVDAQGYEVSCDESLFADMATTPEDRTPVPSEDAQSSGCPIRPTGTPPPPRDPHDPLGLRPGQLPPEVSAKGEEQPPEHEVVSMTIEARTMGAMVVTSTVVERMSPAVVPFWEVLADARERRSERRDARRRRKDRRLAQGADL